MKLSANVQQVIDDLGLQPHPEGGFFRETWRSALEIEVEGYDGVRSAGTSILFLLPHGVSSAWHRVTSDELWFWQGGDPLVLSIRANGEHTLGPSNPQVLVPGRAWQSATPARGPAGYTLCGCVVVPGFDFADFEMDDQGPGAK